MARFGSHVGSLQEIDRLRHKLLCLSIILELCGLFLKHETDSLSCYTERFDLILHRKRYNAVLRRLLAVDMHVT